MKIIKINNKYFEKVQNGVGHLKSEYIYKNEVCAQKWLKLTHDPDYPYYQRELIQIQNICSNNGLKALQKCQAGIHLGPADSAKELCIIKHISNQQQKFYSLIIDSSEPLMCKALENFAFYETIETFGINADILTINDLTPEHLAAPVLNMSPKFFSVFGNTVGNYDGLTVVESLFQMMKPTDYIIFGVHLINNSYAAYESSGYYAHMNSVLNKIGLSNKHGTLITEVKNLNQGNVDRINIKFDLSDQFIFISTNEKNRFSNGEYISEIVLDTSSKYSLHFLNEEIDRIGLQILDKWISDVKDNLIILCQRVQ